MPVERGRQWPRYGAPVRTSTREPLVRPDGALLHREVRGQGAVVVVAPHFFAFPDVYSALIDDLARDRRVLTYDPRGAGRSSRRGPWSEDTDVADLAAVIEEEGNEATVAGFGDGALRGLVLARQRPDLVRRVISVGAGPMTFDLAGAGGLAGSRAAIEMMLDLMRRDTRAALRMVVRTFNSQMSEEQARDRVEQLMAYAEPEAFVSRSAYLGENRLDDALAVGGRFWFLRWESLFLPREATARLRELLPEAHFVDLPDGATSRPDAAAAAIRRISEEP